MRTYRYALVTITRSVVTWLVAGLCLLPLSFGIFFGIEKLFATFPTMHLVALATGVGLVGMAVAGFLPRARAAVRDQLFTGSFDYDERVRKLAAEIVEDASASDPIAHTRDELTRSIGCQDVRFIEHDLSGNVRGATSLLTPRLLAVSLPGSTTTPGLLILEQKTNGDPWVIADLRLLEWFVRTVSVTLNLARERNLEQRRFEQVKQQVITQTTELSQLNDRLTQRDKDLTSRLDELAHDFKNPLTHMANALERATWMVGEDTEKLGADFATVRAEVMWMAKFVDHMLDLARADAGKVTLRRSPVLLADLLDDVVYELAKFCSVQGRSIEWDKFVVHERNLSLQADAGLLFKVFRLLLTRAVRMTLTTVGLAVTTDMERRNVLVDIIVDPVGAASEDTVDGTKAPGRASGKPGRVSGQPKHKQLLERFEHEPGEGDDRLFGITGLELAIARWILSAHGGDLRIAEADERRTVLRATLPIQRAKEKTLVLPARRRQAFKKIFSQ